MDNSGKRTRRGFAKACVLMSGAPREPPLLGGRLSPAKNFNTRPSAWSGEGITRPPFDFQARKSQDGCRRGRSDSPSANKIATRMDGVKTFSDWREMFETMGKDIDVVSVSTPDHMHGIMAMSAMNLGKHV